MADRTKIEWSDATWNPIAGCTRVSEGCRNCYATPIAARFQDTPAFTGLAHYVNRPDGTREARWTGAVHVRENLMDRPLRWQAPRRIFVNSMSDLFHDAVPDEVINRIFAVMARCPQHTFQILTKRPERMRTMLRAVRRPGLPERVTGVLSRMARDRIITGEESMRAICRPVLALPNVWLGVSVEDQVTADVRIPYLLDTPAAIRFVSYEPALGQIDWRQKTDDSHWRDWLSGECKGYLTDYSGLPRLDLVIMGGESGPHARPMHPDWVRQTRDQCGAAGVPFFFKQWGEWAPQLGAVEIDDDPEQSRYRWAEWTDWGAPGKYDWDYTDRPQWCDEMDPEHSMIRVGKRTAGRLLDGVEHNGMPEAPYA